MRNTLPKPLNLGGGAHLAGLSSTWVGRFGMFWDCLGGGCGASESAKKKKKLCPLATALFIGDVKGRGCLLCNSSPARTRRGNPKRKSKPQSEQTNSFHAGLKKYRNSCKTHTPKNIGRTTTAMFKGSLRDLYSSASLLPSDHSESRLGAT